MIKRSIYTVICSIILILALTGMSAVSAAVPNPTDIERKTVNGTEFIVKIFTVSENITADMLIEDDFETDGYIFSHTNTGRKENISETTKYASKQASLESSSNNASTILSQFTQSMSYGEDGYFGALTLDAASLVTQVSGYGTRNTPVSRTREIRGLMFNDPSAVPKAITDDGVTLTLAGIECIVTGTALAGDALVPVEYKAVASYSGTKSVSYVSGYTSTVNYTGTVTKKTVDSINYTITYTGTLIPVTTTEEPPPATEEVTEESGEIPGGNETEDEPGEAETSETGGKNILGVLWAALIICLTAAGAFGVIYYLKYIKKKPGKAEVSAYNLVGGEYVLLGAEPIEASEDTADLSIDLDKFSEEVKSNSFGFVLDKHSAETLNGKTIGVSYNGETIPHMINKTDGSGEYRFRLVFGGEP